MDAAGKDGTIKHVMSGVNPQGCQVSSFKAPTSEDLDHDYLWRCQKALPERGRIGIFNRSYYEETLVVRVHPEFLAGQKLPEQCVTKRIWDERFQDIRAFERYLTRNGTIVRKFFLHVSKKEQQKRFLERLDLPEKNWKFSANDAKERGFWDDYMKAYEETIRDAPARLSRWSGIVPAVSWLQSYKPAWFRADLVAGVTLAAYLLPAGLGDASLANLPPEAGLYACLFGGLVFWLFCSSRHTTITVTSAISLLVGASLGGIAGGDTSRFSALAAGTAVRVACIAF